MEIVYLILGIAGLIAIYWIVESVLSKGFSVASKAAKQNILYRSEHKEGQELVRETLAFQTTTAMPVVMAALSKHVVTAEKCNSFTGVVYETSRSENMVSYAYGNPIYPHLFEGVVALTENEGVTDCLFTITKWTETDGIIETQSQMKKLRKQVKTAFESLEVVLDISGNNIFTEVGSRYCPNCGSGRRNSAKHCPNCGVSLNKKVTDNSANVAGNTNNSVSVNDDEGIDFTAVKKRKTVFQIIGCVLSLIGIVKFMFIGYYQSEWPLFFGILIAGCVFFYLASKIRTEE